jgi:hypothetical protein
MAMTPEEMPMIPKARAALEALSRESSYQSGSKSTRSTSHISVALYSIFIRPNLSSGKSTPSGVRHPMLLNAMTATAVQRST